MSSTSGPSNGSAGGAAARASSLTTSYQTTQHGSNKAPNSKGGMDLDEHVTADFDDEDDLRKKKAKDRQARGKDPYRSDDELSDGSVQAAGFGGSSQPTNRFGQTSKDDFARQERRQRAASFLETPELLMMYAQSTGHTMQSARLHFMSVLCGYDEESLGRGYRASSSTRRNVNKRRGGDRAVGP